MGNIINNKLDMVQEVVTQEEFETILKENQKVVVDFTAKWCGPCKVIGPEFEKMESKYPNIKFVKVDVDDNEAVAASQGISAMPTFHAFIKGDKSDDLVGANKDKLEEMIQKVNSA